MLPTRRTSSRLLVVGTTEAEILELLPLANVLARSRRIPQSVAVLVVIPLTQSLSAGARTAQALREALHAKLAPEVRLRVRVTHDPAKETNELIHLENSELVLLQASATYAPTVLRQARCDVMLVKGTLPANLSHILLPIRGGPYAALALESALAFAQAAQAEITLLHAATPYRMRDAAVRALFRHLDSLPTITQRLRAQGSPAEAILEQAKPRHHQLLVMGASARLEMGESALGNVATRVLAHSGICTLVVKSAEELPQRAPIDSTLAVVDYTISVIVDKWFAENTFHAHEFEDIRQLVDLKEKQGLTISLGLPTLNEQETIGSVIRTMRKRFVQDYPLLDEIVVIDSNSTDRTIAIAEGLGVPVVKHPEVLTQYGSWAGKGEALWNSLYVLKGDLIAWIDTDIVNIHPRFVHGILGPLIREPHLMYVKGFYQRPLRMGNKVQARGGGRVTELVARPMFNLFYPELSGFVQPLAGEYAGRRTALEQVPFYVGYGVETGLLIDLWMRFGLQAMGQVDLEERVHRNQSLASLSKMAFEITQVFMQRVGEARGVELVENLQRSMKLIRYEDDAFELDVADVQIRERPPMISIPEYAKLRKKRSLRRQKKSRRT